MTQTLTFTKAGDEYVAEAGDVQYCIARTTVAKVVDEDDELIAEEVNATEWQPAVAWRYGHLWSRAPQSFRTLDEAKFWCEQDYDEQCTRVSQSAGARS